MATMDQVLERLDETERQAGEVVRQLERAEALHESLVATRKGLDTVAGDVKKLITATRKGMNALGEAVSAFRTATETIQQSDPSIIAAALASIDKRVDSIASEVSAMSQAKGAIIAELKATIFANEELTREMIDNAFNEMSEQSLMERVFGQHRTRTQRNINRHQSRPEGTTADDPK